jgi:Flp pilus assembly protein TadB
MSKERARRRAVREAATAQRVSAAAERTAKQVARRRRRSRLRAAFRTALPWLPGQRWSRRTRGQRYAVFGALLGVGVFAWLITPSWDIRIAVWLTALLATPALVTMALDRSTH